MINSVKRYIGSFFRRRSYRDIDPDEIFVDSKNLPDFDVHQFEGRLSQPIPYKVFYIFLSVCIFIGLAFIYKVWDLQITNGVKYAEKSLNNSLENKTIFASRGTLYDRNNVQLAWNSVPTEDNEFPKRDYINTPGFGHLLGFLKYPTKDSSGFYYRQDYEPQDGLELSMNSELAGKNGLQIVETDVAGKVVSGSLLDKPEDGAKINLSIDSRIQAKLYEYMTGLASKVSFKGGAGIIMDVNSGEIIALVSFPEYDSQVLTDGSPKDAIRNYYTNPGTPFLNRAVAGLYAPGSIVKPVMAFAALEEGVISPDKQIVTNGRLVIPNPYFPDQPSIFLDWKNNGVLDMRHAIAMSSDVYFYEIGGGFQDQKGLGILNIKKYLQKFGYGAPTGIGIGEEAVGNIPDPDWKNKIFGEDWRLGDTYHTVIGQYGMQVTPIQVVRAISAIANDGTLVKPTFLKQATTTVPVGTKIGGDPAHYQVVHEGMRLSAEIGTSIGLNVPYVHIAGKTGTAELGVAKDRVNSWTVGFFPYEHPHYAYTIVMESGPVKNLMGATSVMRQLIDWMNVNAPEYFK